MEFLPIIYQDDLWEKAIEYALKCPWEAGPYLANEMKNHKFNDWERVFVAINDGIIIGFCTFTKIDCIPDVSYTPFIGFLFVDESFRGKRISEKMIKKVMEYAKNLNFKQVYLASDHENLYEKYGFVKIDEKDDFWGNREKIYMHYT